MSEEKDALKKLIMLISDLRAKDEERYEAHVNFMNETIKMISAIESQMNKHWSTVLESLKELNNNINSNLDSLLTGINPKGLRETSKSLQEIMDTMNKSVQTMNLEKVLSELKILKSLAIQASPGAYTPTREPELYGYVPKKKKKDENEDEHRLMRPSDLQKVRTRVKRDGDQNGYFPYPYIFKPPSPPGDLGVESQSQIKKPIKKKPESKIYCQYCGKELTEDEQLSHNCRKRP